MKLNWDKRYANAEYIYGKEPNAYFKWFIDHHKKGSILLPGEGEGRNAVYAASKGWEIHAIDYSVEAKKKALKLAREKGVDIRYENHEISAIDDDNRYDAIALIYLHLPSADRMQFHKKLQKLLYPGGYILLEAFTKEQLKHNSGGPKNIDMLYEPDEIKEDFNSLKLLEFSKQEVHLEEGQHHQGTAHILRALFRK